MDEGNRLAESALLWLGTPYHHNAKIRGVGVDCARFVIGACEDAGLLEKDILMSGRFIIREMLCMRWQKNMAYR